MAERYSAEMRVKDQAVQPLDEVTKCLIDVA